MSERPQPSPPERTPLQRAGAHLRAAFILFHCVAIFLMAFPSPGSAMKKSAWRDPTVQAEFAAWTERINGWGADITQQELEDELWELALVYTEGRNTLLKPLRPYYKYTCTPQSWRMFVAPHRYPAKLEIHVKIDGQWVPAYIARDPEHNWQGRALDHDRFRSAIFRFSWSAYAKTYKSFQTWVGVRAAADFPQATHVRTQFQKYKTPSPEQVKSGKRPKPKVILTRVQDLEDYR